MKEHVYLRGKTYTYVIDAGQDAFGKRRQVSKGGFATKREAHAAARDALVKVETEGRYDKPSKELLGGFLSRWLETRTVESVAPNTLALHRRFADAYVIPRIGGVQLRRVTPELLTTFYAELLANGRRNPKAKDKTLSRVTVAKVHVMLLAAFRDAVKWRAISTNPAQDASAPSGKSPVKLATWTDGQLRQFLRTVEGDRLEPAYVLLATTGMRRGEVLGLRWCDLDLPHARLSVVQTLVTIDYRVTLSEPKTDTSRRAIALDGQTISHLREHRRRQLEERSSLGLPWPRPEELVFTAIDGAPLHPDGFSDRFGRLVRAANLPWLTVHGLRHTWATLALQAGESPKVVQERLGHKDVATTLGIYSHVIPAMETAAAERIAGVIFGGSVSNSLARAAVGAENDTERADGQIQSYGRGAAIRTRDLLLPKQAL